MKEELASGAQLNLMPGCYRVMSVKRLFGTMSFKPESQREVEVWEGSESLLHCLQGTRRAAWLLMIKANKPASVHFLPHGHKKEKEQERNMSSCPCKSQAAPNDAMLLDVCLGFQPSLGFLLPLSSVGMPDWGPTSRSPSPYLPANNFAHRDKTK